jgi:hypothetical protein
MDQKLKELLRKKKRPGDVWHTLHTPEDYTKWDYENPWPEDEMRHMGVNFLSARVYQAQLAGETTEERFTASEPWRLPCGVEIRKGKMRTWATKKSVTVEIRADSVLEFNQAMSDISEATGLFFWELKNLNIYNKNEAVTVNFQLFDPDSHGTGLYMHHIRKGKHEKYYFDLMLTHQQDYCGEFYEKVAHCTAGQILVDTHDCALKNKLKSKQIKLRKKNK